MLDVFKHEKISFNNFFKLSKVNFSKLYLEKKNYISKRITENYDINKVVEEIKSRGFFLMDSLLDEKFILNINKEFDLQINSKKNYINDIKFSAKQIRLGDRFQLHEENCNYTFSVMNNPILRKIIYNLLNRKFYYNFQTFFQINSPSSDTPAGELHFDKIHEYKIWIFVNDTNTNNGPIELFPKTHLENRIFRKKNYLNKTNFNNVIDPNKNSYTGEKIIANRGSVLIFDSDLLHRATEVISGNRKIIRSHSITPDTKIYWNEIKRNLPKN